MFGQGAVLAEYGSTQIEFQYLSDLTGNTKYAEAVCYYQREPLIFQLK
jgi:hypothetical protein